jgi:hypothetical protein
MCDALLIDNENRFDGNQRGTARQGAIDKHRGSREAPGRTALGIVPSPKSFPVLS